MLLPSFAYLLQISNVFFMFSFVCTQFCTPLEVTQVICRAQLRLFALQAAWLLSVRTNTLALLVGSGWVATATSHLSPGTFICRVLRSCLVPQRSHASHWPCHQRRSANCDWMTASYTNGQSSYACRHPTCWASLQRSHTVSSTTSHRAWTSQWECTESQIETPICARCTTTHQFIWRQWQKCSPLGGSPMECG